MPVDPADLKLVTYPNPVLRAKAAPVPKVDAEVRAVAQRMLQIMRDERGIGLAAPQVGLSWRLFVVDVPEPEPDDDEDAVGDETGYPIASDGPAVYINPTFSSPAGALCPMEEGCLSLPEIRGEVRRPPVITITALDANGNQFTQTASGLLARCWQHEMDHLDGVLILDRMTQISRIKNRKAIKALEG